MEGLLPSPWCLLLKTAVSSLCCFALASLQNRTDVAVARSAVELVKLPRAPDVS